MKLDKYLDQAFIMQLATVRGEQPWICNVYFVADEVLNLYWLSYPSRRHSLEVADNSLAAITMAIKTDKPVVGLSAEGRVSIVDDVDVVKSAMQKYTEKYNAGARFHENLMKSTNEHVMYKFTPTKYVLFDELNFAPEDARQEIQINQ